MPPVRPSPAERVRESLQASRADNVPFKLAWQQARDAALADINNRRDGLTNWRVALAWARPHFEAAYLGDPAGRCACGLTLDGLRDLASH